jgi:type I restriction enzyme, S subunit
MTSSSFGEILAEPLRNGVYKRKELHGSGAPVINMKELFAFDYIDGQATDWVKLEASELARMRLELGDLLFARRSFVLEGAGKCSIVRSLTEPTTFESSMIRARLDRSRALPKFFFYFFKSPQGRNAMASIATRMAVSGITGKNLAALTVPLPALGTQRKIIAILSAYDDLIDNNNRRIKILEVMAQRIYQEWFVEFRYPGHKRVRMRESVLGLVPTDWRVEPLSALAEVVMGQSPPSTAYNKTEVGLPFHQGVGSYGRHFPAHRTYSTSGSRHALAGDTLVSVRAPVGRINIADRDLIIGRGLAAIRASVAPRHYLLHTLMHAFREEDAMGNGAIFNSVTKREMEGLPVVWPGLSLAQRFEKLIRPFWCQIAVLTKLNENARNTRDLLLPHLISGEVNVEDLGIAMGDAAA